MSIDNETALEYAGLLTGIRNHYGALRMMLGTQHVWRVENGIEFDLHGSAHRTPVCKMIYNVAQDLFELHFYRSGKLVKSFDMLFADQIREVFENYTGLRITMPRICGLNA